MTIEEKIIELSSALEYLNNRVDDILNKIYNLEASHRKQRGGTAPNRAVSDVHSKCEHCYVYNAIKDKALENNESVFGAATDVEILIDHCSKINHCI